MGYAVVIVWNLNTLLKWPIKIIFVQHDVFIVKVVGKYTKIYNTLVKVALLSIDEIIYAISCHM